MLVDIGDGVTDIAVIRSGNLIATSAVRTACSDLHHAVRDMVSSQYQVLLYAREAERLTRQIGVTPSTVIQPAISAAGISSSSGLETSVVLSYQEIFEAMRPV